MKRSQILLISGGVVVGFALGLILSPFLRQTGPEGNLPVPQKPVAANPPDVIDGPEVSSLGNRVRERGPSTKKDSAHISMPVKTVMELLREGKLGGTGFNRLDKVVEEPLEILGASPTERDEIKSLIKRSQDEIRTAESTHFKLALVTTDRIEIDTSGIREPVSAIIGRLQSGIQATLNPQAAEILISAIDWKAYYRINEKALITTLEIDRDETGELMAQIKTGNSSSGKSVGKKFTDDGTPLPADQVFPELWRPYLKGLTIVPKVSK